MHTISKDFAFSASHTLHGLPDGHPCARLHGHNFTVRVELASDTLDPAGFVLDYNHLAPLGAWLDEQFDHRHLNDVVDFQPSAENMSRHIHAWCAAQGWPVTRVGWSETPKTWAWYEETP
jgi:6-pyruvoyltetrahydropterin/6-carboxytetrahydropterin synthase